MDRIRITGTALSVAPLSGDVVDVTESYPWRAGSPVGVVSGVTLLALGDDR